VVPRQQATIDITPVAYFDDAGWVFSLDGEPLGEKGALSYELTAPENRRFLFKTLRRYSGQSRA
jgi:hypothetical protein